MLCITNRVLWYSSLPRKNQWETCTNIFAMYTIAAVVRSIVSRWVKRVTSTETGSGVPAFESLRLSCLAATWLSPSFVKINASQLDNWCSYFQSAMEVLTSFEIWDIRRHARCVGSSEPHSRTRNRRKIVSSEFLAHFAAEGGTFLSRIFTPGETCVHNFKPETKSTS